MTDLGCVWLFGPKSRVCGA